MISVIKVNDLNYIKKFVVEVFYITLDHRIDDMERIFQNVRYVTHFFKYLQPISLKKLDVEKLYNAAQIFKKTTVEQDISLDVIHQFRFYLKDIISNKIKTIRELADILLIEHSPLTTTYSDICTAFILYLMLPIIIASVERSYSKLKQFKYYL